MRGRASSALVVPDQETWVVTTGDGSDAVRPTVEAGRADLLIVPERVPGALVEAVRSQWREMPERRAIGTYAAAPPGVPARHALGHQGDDSEHEGHGDGGGGDGGGGDDHGDHGDGDHGDMMAITGEPSADGLVMESIDVEVGPLAPALPGGLVIAASLDGDVVSDCQVRQTLEDAADVPAGDIFVAVAWSVADLAVREAESGVAALPEGRWFRLVAVEVERAVGHVAWLHQLCRLLGWARMVARVRALLAELLRLRGVLPVELTAPDLPDVSAGELRGGLGEAHVACRRVADDLAASRALTRRTAGLGAVGDVEAGRRGLAGPAARASGSKADARADDPGYLRLGFEPVVRREGDARARVLVRAAEAAQSMALAGAAIELALGAGDDAEGVPEFRDPAGGVVESKRGPVRVAGASSGERRATADGARALREAAGELAVGREWASALVTVASFDVSPWRVGP